MPTLQSKIIFIESKQLDISQKEHIINTPETFKPFGLEVDENNQALILFILMDTDTQIGNMNKRKFHILTGNNISIDESDIFVGVRRINNQNYFLIDKGWI